MKVFFKNKEGKEIEIQVSYVNDKDDRYLVLIDNENKIKYTPYTYSSYISDHSIFSLIYNYASSVYDIVINGYRRIGNLNRVCHNDDFYNHYKKKYNLIGTSECRTMNIKY